MLLEKLKLVPHKPGCYLMKNKDGVIIYVGKAKDLKNRLNSYFHSSHTGKTARLVSEINDFEYIVVASETESLILELNLIKKNDPKYNILLRDDKTYPYIEITDEKVPRLLIVRKPYLKKNKTRLFGPYPNVTAARTTVNLLNRIYPLRKCKTYSKKPCLYYHIGQCLGYCANNVDQSKIKKMETDIIKFLKGDHREITNNIKLQIEEESSKLNYEKAKELNELLEYIKVVLTKQKVEINENIPIDVFGYFENNDYLSVFILFIRESKIIESHHKIIPLIDSKEEELTRFIAKFYEKKVKPKKLLVPNIVNEKLLSNYLDISVNIPIKGSKNKILLMANENAKKTLEDEIELLNKNEERTFKANEQLKLLLNLEKLDRIELFDNSNLFGTFNVSGMVVFKNGLPAKNEYRKYKISIDKNDDYGTMREVIYRRYFKVLSEDLEKPDLIIVDGGIGQLNIANEVLNSLNLDIKIIGLKKDDKHSTDSIITLEKEINIEKRSNLFYYLERMQDEVHNYTINYHRKLRSKGAYTSILDSIEGIGESRKKKLLNKYKNLDNIKNADINELKKLIPEKSIKELLEKLKEN